MTTEEIKALTKKYEDERYFKNDPIQIVKRYKDPKDIEVAAVICSTLAFGNRKQIYKACEETMKLMGDSPYEYIKMGLWEQYEGNKTCWYRMLTWHDFYMICFKLNKAYKLYNDLQDCLIDTCNSVATSYIEAMTMIFNSCNGIPKNAVSTCKRLCLMLKWLVRQDSKIDIGIWTRIEPQELLLPLDVHSISTLRELGIITRKSNDMKTVIQATEWAKTIFYDDPTKLDFFLFGYSYEKSHPQEFEEPKQEEYKVTSLDILLSATYLILWLNDCATNLIKEIEYDVRFKDKEAIRIYGALKRRVNAYQRDMNRLVGDKEEWYAEFCLSMDDIFDSKVNDLKQAICEVYRNVGYEDPKYLSLVEIARLMSEYVCKVNDKMTCDLRKITDKAIALRGYKLDEIHKIMENFSTWTYRKCHDLNMNKFDNVVNKFHVIDEAVSDINNTLGCINKANEYIGE